MGGNDLKIKDEHEVHLTWSDYKKILREIKDLSDENKKLKERNDRLSSIICAMKHIWKLSMNDEGERI